MDGIQLTKKQKKKKKRGKLKICGEGEKRRETRAGEKVEREFIFFDTCQKKKYSRLPTIIAMLPSSRSKVLQLVGAVVSAGLLLGKTVLTRFSLV